MAKDFRHVALTWRQVLAIILLIVTLILVLASTAVYDNMPPADIKSLRINLGIASAICGAVSLSLFIWNYRIARQPNIHPDILAQLFGGDYVSELDSLHFFAMGRQMGPDGAQVRVVVLLQNVYEAPCSGRLQLNPVGTTCKIPQANLPLEYSMAGAEVLACWRDLPVPVTGELSFEIEGFIRKNRSRRVRFQRRTAIRSGTASNALLVAGLLAGHVAYHQASRINIKLESPPAGALAAIAPGPWETMSLWSLEDQRSLEAIRELLSKLMKD